MNFLNDDRKIDLDKEVTERL
jgi:hypothetical protein